MSKNVSRNSKKGKTFTKLLLIFILIIILFSIILYYFYKKYSVNLTTNNNFDEENQNSTIINVNNQEDTKLVNVLGDENLVITELEILEEDGFCYITYSIKNISSNTLENLPLTILIEDENEQILAELTSPIEKIEPDEIIESYGVVELTLPEKYNCIIKKQE